MKEQNRKTLLRLILNLLATLVVISIFSGCRVKFPTVPEQQKILADGGFPGGVPPWSPDMVLTNQSSDRSSTGLMPSGFSSSSSMAKRRMTFAERKDERKKQIEKTQTKKEDTDKQDSPLHRISAECPQLEAEVTKTLVDTDPSSRLSALKRLSAQCPDSPDLWYWQAKDYFQSGDNFEAKRCLDHALMIDSKHKESLELSRKVKSALEIHTN